MEMNEYIPRPRDTQGIELPESLKGLSEAMAAHTHELWMYQQYLKGWRYASENDNKEKKTLKMALMTSCLMWKKRILLWLLQRL